jgi:ribosomal protein S18 acetylase RimI-like enzyme
MEALVERMRALEHRVHEAAATRREEFAGGVAYFDDELPVVYDANFVRLDRDCPGPAGEIDRLQAGLGHRKVLVEDESLLERVGPALRARGLAQRGLVVLAREPGGMLDPDVRELPFEELMPVRRQAVAERQPLAEPGVVEQLARHGERRGGRWLVAFGSGRAAAQLVVFSHGGLAQIEDVVTLEDYRGRGLAKRLIGHALELVAPDHDTVFLAADADDWPVDFYRRLGFRHVESRADFTLIVAGS